MNTTNYKALYAIHSISRQIIPYATYLLLLSRPISYPSIPRRVQANLAHGLPFCRYINNWLAICRTTKEVSALRKTYIYTGEHRQRKNETMLRAGFQPTTPVSERHKNTHLKPSGLIHYRNLWCSKFQISHPKNFTKFENLMELCNMLILLRPGSISPTSHHHSGTQLVSWDHQMPSSIWTDIHGYERYFICGHTFGYILFYR